jgi:quercetin dioxygenase-like cupin family protein
VQIVRSGASGRPSRRRSDTFSGEVWMDQVLSADGAAVNDVFFAPGARTHWHSHADGQVLLVLAGSGMVCPEGGQPERVGPGDLVWALPGERHWHGAAPDSYCLHRAVSLGQTSWSGEVGVPER